MNIRMWNVMVISIQILQETHLQWEIGGHRAVWCVHMLITTAWMPWHYKIGVYPFFFQELFKI